MAIQRIVLTALLAFTGAACLSLPEEGGNPHDPLSPTYKPQWPLVYVYPRSSTKVDVTWVDRSLGETGFEIVRSRQIDSGYVTIATVAADVTVYSDTSSAFVRRGVYYYRVRALAPVRSSAWSNEGIARIP